MRGAKSAPEGATFGAASPIRRYMLAVLLALSGCWLPAGVPEERYQRAQQLVDEGTRALQEQRFDAAQVSFSLAYDLAPLAAALDGQGCVALVRGEYERAEELFRAAHESDEGYDHALANLALLYDVTGRSREALELYDRVLREDPQAAPVRNNRAALAHDLAADRRWVADELLKASLSVSDGVVTENLRVARRDVEGQHDEESN